MEMSAESLSDCPRKHSAWQQRAFQNAAPRGGRNLQAENQEGLGSLLHLSVQKKQATEDWVSALGTAGGAAGAVLADGGG